MLKNIFSFFILNCFLASAFAENTCIKHISAHEVADRLDLSNCHLQDQDIPAVAAEIQNSTIGDLDLSHNNIGPMGISYIKSLSQYMKKINLDDNNLGDQGVTVLASIITSSIDTLSFRNNHLTDKAAFTLAKIPLPTSLYLTDNKITAAGAIELAKNPSLHYLWIENTLIGDEGTIALAKHPTLVTLMVANNQLTDACTTAIGESKSLMEVDLTNNKITANGAVELAKSPSINFLYLAKNKLGDAGISAFVNTKKLRWFDVSDNQITAQGAKTISTKSYLEKLFIAKNPIGADGAAALTKTYGLSELDISDINLGDEGITTFALNHPRIGHIHLSNNHITAKGVAALLSGISGGITYALDLSSNDIGDLGIAMLAKRSDIQSFDLRNTHISAIGVFEFAKSRYDMYSLNLSDNNIGDAGAASIAKVNHSRFIDMLTLENCGITEKGALAIANEKYKSRFLDIKKNAISKKGIAALRELYDTCYHCLEIDEE